MDNISIDLKKVLPFVIEAFTFVYGEKYRDIISDKINNAIIIQHYNIESLKEYILYIEECQKREYAVKFLEKIGVNVEKYKKANYTEELDSEVENLLEYYIDSSYFGFSDKTDYYVPLQAFKQGNNENPKKLLQNKIKIINYLLDDEHELVTEKNFDLFTKTEEYQQILKKIDELNLVYEPLLSEYRKREEKLKPYKDYLDSETGRKAKILEKNKQLLFEDIYQKLPMSMKAALSSKSLEEKITTILGSTDIGSVSIIELFNSNRMKKLKSENVDVLTKSVIVSRQLNYLKSICGYIVSGKEIKFGTEENINKYLTFLEQEDVKQYIPSDDLIHFVTSTREKKYEEALREYYTTREDFLNFKEQGFNEDSLEYIYENMKGESVFVFGRGATTDDNKFVSIMFYTIRNDDGGSLCFTFMHECGHIIDQNENGIAFESCMDFSDSSMKNPYDSTCRRYEKFNETLNDIFTIEAIEFLHSQGIYLIEPQKFTLEDVSNYNTALITKNLLQPLLLKFRSQVISAKINADQNELTRYIGQDNFEELVDVVNKVDYLSRNGVINKIETSPEDELVKEYFKQVNRAEKIYHNIDDYYDNNYQTLTLGKHN